MQGKIAHNFSCQSGSDSLVSSGNNAHSSDLKSERHDSNLNKND